MVSCTVPSALFPIFVGLTTAKVKDYIAQLPSQQSRALHDGIPADTGGEGLSAASMSFD